MFAGEHGALQPLQRQSRDALYERLKRWDDLLPEIFDWEKVPPHVILLKSVLSTASTLDEHSANYLAECGIMP
jgi:hypothetical protein